MTKTMEKCRLCLSKIKAKNLTSLFQSVSSLLYSDMVKEIANVQISQNDGLPDKLCHTCRRKVKELYDFKILIESSDVTLRGTSHSKKISFSNINDVKLDLTLVKEEKNNYENIFEKLHFDNKENIIYNDIVISRFQPQTNESGFQPTKVKIESNLMLIDDFLDSINDEYGDGDDGQFTGHPVEEELVDTDYGLSSNDEGDPASDEEGDSEPTVDLQDLPLAMRKVIRQNEERARRLQRRRLREEEDDEDWNMPAQAQKKFGEKRQKKNYPKDLDELSEKPKRVRFIPPLIKTNIKPELWTNLEMIKYPYRKTNRKPKEIKATLCPHCGLEYKDIESHLQTHSDVKKYTCELCPNRSYFTKAGHYSHMLTHTSERKFKCQKCSVSFYTRASLNNHQKSHGEKTFKCSYCDKMFKWKAGRLRHELSHSAANKNVKCDMCNMSFFDKSGLTHHMRIHTGERPFKCEICNQPYSYKHDFNRHCMNKHGVFLKRRDVRIMNEEVLAKEREITKGLVLRAHGIAQEGEPYNPIENEGNRGAQAFTQFLKDVKKGKVPIQLEFDP